LGLGLVSCVGISGGSLFLKEIALILDSFWDVSGSTFSFIAPMVSCICDSLIEGGRCSRIGLSRV
jgi:hypothetical protein